MITPLKQTSSGSSLKKSNQSAKKSSTPKPGSSGILKYCQKNPRFQSVDIHEEYAAQTRRERKRSLRDKKDVNYKVDSETESIDKEITAEDSEVVCIDSDEDSDSPEDKRAGKDGNLGQESCDQNTNKTSQKNNENSVNSTKISERRPSSATKHADVGKTYIATSNRDGPLLSSSRENATLEKGRHE